MSGLSVSARLLTRFDGLRKVQELRIGHLENLGGAVSASPIVRLSGNPLFQLMLLVLLFNAGSWGAIKWLEER